MSRIFSSGEWRRSQSSKHRCFFILVLTAQNCARDNICINCAHRVISRTKLSFLLFLQLKIHQNLSVLNYVRKKRIHLYLRKLSVWQGWYQCCIFAWFVLWWHFEPWYWARLDNSWRERNMPPSPPLFLNKKKFHIFVKDAVLSYKTELVWCPTCWIPTQKTNFSSVHCFCPICAIEKGFSLVSVMSWRWRASSSSSWQWRERSGSSTHCATCTIHSPSLRLSSSATPRERSACWKPLAMPGNCKSAKNLWQGMTIRTARLPGAGNLLGRAGEDLSGLPDWARRYHFIFIDSIIFQFKH